MKNRFYLFSLLSVLLSLCGCGTDDYVAVVGKIEGTVLNSATHEPVAGCEVISNRYGTTLTDGNGHFSFSDLEPGRVTLTYKANGYDSATRDITVTAGNTVMADVTLNPTVVSSALTVDKTILDFGNRVGVLNLILSNSTSSSISYNITSNAGWITTDPTHGTVLSGRESTVRVSVNRDGLSDGSYDRVLTIETSTGNIEVQVLVDKGSETRPSVNTLSLAQSQDNSASITARGAITVVGSSTITRHGFCYAVGMDPTLEDNAGYTNLGDINSPQDFTSIINNLEYGKEYHVRAYATNNAGTAYGDVLKITLKKAEYGTVVTGTATNITTNSATLNGSTAGAASSSFSNVGFYYGTTPDCSTQSGNAVVSGSSFSIQLSGLTPDTEYFFKAYGDDNRGRQTGEIKSFRTAKESSSSGITMITSPATNVEVYSATMNGALNVGGNAKVKEYGFFYGTSSNPTLRVVEKSYNSPTTISSVTYSSNLTNLNQNTRYYFQAYALDGNNNIIRGSEQTFTTKVQPSMIINSMSVTMAGRYLYDSQFNIDGSATLKPEGNSVLEAGFIFSMYSQYCDVDYKYNNSRIQCEVVNNTITCRGQYRMDWVTNYFVYARGYMILADGRVIYSGEAQQFNIPK